MSEENKPSVYELTARSFGWEIGDGHIFDKKVFESWKAAVSWSGSGALSEEERDSVVYDSWEACCEGEGFVPGVLNTDHRATGRASLHQLQQQLDRELPHTFDLLWDIKRESQLRRHLQNAVSDLVGMNEMLRQHEFKLEWDTSFEVTPQQMERIAMVSRFIKDPTDDGWQTLVEDILRKGVRVNAFEVPEYTEEGEPEPVAKPFACFVQLETNGLGVGLQGLGLCEMETGYEAVAYLDYQDGTPSLRVWGDINDPDPDSFDLSSALESNRKAFEDE